MARFGDYESEAYGVGPSSSSKQGFDRDNSGQGRDDYESEAYGVGPSGITFGTDPSYSGGAGPNYTYTRPDGMQVTDFSRPFTTGVTNARNLFGGGGGRVQPPALDLIRSTTPVMSVPYVFSGEKSTQYPVSPTSYDSISDQVRDVLLNTPGLVTETGPVAEEPTFNFQDTTGIMGLARKAREAITNVPGRAEQVISGLGDTANFLSEGVDLGNFAGGKLSFDPNINLNSLSSGVRGLMSGLTPTIQYTKTMDTGLFNKGGEVEAVQAQARSAYLPETFFQRAKMSDSGIMSTMEGLEAAYPEAFDEMMRRNTEAEINRLNRLQFEEDEMLQGSPTPVIDKFLIDEAVYQTAVPPGFEDLSDMEPDSPNRTGGVAVSGRSRFFDLTPRTMVPGQFEDQSILHETVHKLMPNEDYSTLNPMLRNIAREEASVTGLDMYKAFKEGDMDEFKARIEYLSSPSVDAFIALPGAREKLTENLLSTMMKLRSQAGQPYTTEETSALKKDIFNVMSVAAKEQINIAQERARKQYERERLGE